MINEKQRRWSLTSVVSEGYAQLQKRTQDLELVTSNTELFTRVFQLITQQLGTSQQLLGLLLTPAHFYKLCSYSVQIFKMLSQAVNKKLQELNQAQTVFEQTKERSDAVQKMI